LPEVLEKTLRSYSRLHRTFIFFSLLGILLTITLSVLEAKGIESFGCGGCGKALSSPVAEPFGIHLSWLGVVFYTSLFILSLKFSPPLSEITFSSTTTIDLTALSEIGRLRKCIGIEDKS